MFNKMFRLHYGAPWSRTISKSGNSRERDSRVARKIRTTMGDQSCSLRHGAHELGCAIRNSFEWSHSVRAAEFHDL